MYVYFLQEALRMENPSFLDTFFLKGFVGNILSNTEHEWYPDSKPLFFIVFALSLIAISVAAYLLGSLNFAIIISGKQYKQDIRSFGSKNAGMTNMMRTYGKKAAGLTLLGDALKAMVSCLLGYAVFGQLGAYIAGFFCILGHVFPIYYRFKGGKGVVTAAVAILMCHPIVFLILLAVFLIIVLFTKYISLGSIMCVLIYPVVLSWFPSGRTFAVFAVLTTVIVVFKHWENIKRLRAGTESKFSFKKSVKKAEEVPNESNEDSSK